MMRRINNQRPCGKRKFQFFSFLKHRKLIGRNMSVKILHPKGSGFAWNFNNSCTSHSQLLPRIIDLTNDHIHNFPNQMQHIHIEREWEHHEFPTSASIFQTSDSQWTRLLSWVWDPNFSSLYYSIHMYPLYLSTRCHSGVWGFNPRPSSLHWTTLPTELHPSEQHSVYRSIYKKAKLIWLELVLWAGGQRVWV